MNLTKIIKKPLLTEKTTGLASKSIHAFKVNKEATKLEIKEAVEYYFKVKVASVNTLVGRNKPKRTAKGIVPAKYYKKAMVKLKPGEKIALFEGV